jgi:hypothetical protein
MVSKPEYQAPPVKKVQVASETAAVKEEPKPAVKPKDPNDLSRKERKKQQYLESSKTLKALSK